MKTNRLTVSIDLWGTLIKSNPEFLIEKRKLVRKYINDISDEEIDNAFERAKDKLNAVIEVTGWQPKLDVIHKVLSYELSYKIEPAYPLYPFTYSYQALVIDYPPLIYSDETIEVLSDLARIANLYLSSNTMFIEGNTLTDSLDNKYNLFKDFDVLFFSDQMGFAKPHKNMFPACFHIGDNPITDCWGAEKADSKPIIINSNSLTIKDAYDIIVQGI